MNIQSPQLCDNLKKPAYAKYNGIAGAESSMKQTEKLLQGLTYRCVRGKLPREVTQVAYDSRNVEPGGIFVCIRGSRQDGHQFIRESVRRGASVILTEAATDFKQESYTVESGERKTVRRKECVSCLDENLREIPDMQEVCVLETPDTRIALAAISRQWFDNPQKELCILGVTGTKGKTTTVWMIWKMLVAAGYEAGLIGTIEVCYSSWQQESEYTTPESYDLYEILRKMADGGCKYVVMEVSSQALKLHRVEGIVFDTAVFTNLRADHIGAGEHADFAEYMDCKRQLFRRCRCGVFNQDDAYWQEMWRESGCQAVTYGFSGQSDYCALAPQLLRGSSRLGVRYELTVHDAGQAGMTKGTSFTESGEGVTEKKPEEQKKRIVVNAPGRFSVYNSLAAIAVAEHYQVPWNVMEQVLHTLQVPGRIEMLSVSPRFIVLVDYAHNAMALEALLTTLQDYHPGRIICIFGCGGNRSAERRFQMGEVAGRLADLVVVTTDNPRDEDPEKIADEICRGLDATKGKYGRIPDRGDAIAYGISHAKPGDIVVIAGKGHEKYQEICGQKFPMDDRQLAMKCKVW